MIPIQNIYYLLIYAWDALDEGESISADAEPETTILDLLAGVLNRGIDRLLRRGLDRNYVLHRESLPGLRGKLDLSATIKGNLLSQAKTICEFDDFRHDVLHNRILKATVRELLKVDSLDGSIHTALKETMLRLRDIADIRLTDRHFSTVQLHRNNRIYRLLLDVCRLVHGCLVPDSSGNRLLFRDFLQDEERMHRLFERFVRNFYRHEQNTYSVGREAIHWITTPTVGEDLSLLPQMETDISLTSPERKIVIDAKYYLEALQSRFGKATIRSQHLYQLFSYLRNSSPPQREPPVEGMLLYPTVTRHLDLTYRVHGHLIRICTINLNQHWQHIRKDLLDLISPRS